MLIGPGRGQGFYFALNLHPRQSAIDKSLILHCVQMTPSSLRGIIVKLLSAKILNPYIDFVSFKVGSYFFDHPLGPKIQQKLKKLFGKHLPILPPSTKFSVEPFLLSHLNRVFVKNGFLHKNSLTCTKTGVFRVVFEQSPKHTYRFREEFK